MAVPFFRSEERRVGEEGAATGSVDDYTKEAVWVAGRVVVEGCTTAALAVSAAALRGALPEAATENVADCPAVTVWLAGCVLIEGVIKPASAFGVAALLVSLRVLFRSTTVNCAPLSAVVVAGVV